MTAYQYVLCKVPEASTKVFEDAVTTRLNEGFNLVGGPFIAANFLCQALVKKTNVAETEAKPIWKPKQ